MSKIIANIASDFGAIGVDAAVKIIKALREGEGVMLDVMVSAAHDLAENPQATEDFLAGLADGLVKEGMSKGTAANRKSDCRAIFGAFYITLQNIIMPADYVTDEQKSAFQGERRTMALETLNEFEGGYHGVVAECRKIVNAATGKSAGTTSNSGGPKKISDADGKKIVSRLLNADTPASTALEVMVAAQSAFIRAAGTPVALVRQADRLAMEMQKSSDAYYRTLGEKISKLTQQAIEHADRQADEVKKINDEKLANAQGKPVEGLTPNTAPEAVNTEVHEQQRTGTQG